MKLFTVRPAKDTESIIEKQTNKSGFVNKCIRLYQLAEINKNTPAYKLLQEVEK